MKELRLETREQIENFLKDDGIIEPKESLAAINKRLEKEILEKKKEEDRKKIERLKYVLTHLSKTIELEVNRKKIERIFKILGDW